MRGDTYGVVCALVLFALIGGGSIAFYLVSRKPGSPASAPAPSVGSASAASISPQPTAIAPSLAPENPRDAMLLGSGMAHSQTLARRRVIAKGTISPRAGGYSAMFEYERLDNLERIQIAAGNYVRKVGGPWLRSEGWSVNGSPISDSQASLLGDLIAMTAAPWNAASQATTVTSVAPPTEQAAATILHAKGKGDGRDRLFVFGNRGSELQLNRFSGPIGSGQDEIQLTLDLAYPVASIPKAIPMPSAASARNPAKRRSTITARRPSTRP